MSAQYTPLLVPVEMPMFAAGRVTPTKRSQTEC